MEDSTEFILQNQGSRMVYGSKDNPIVTASTGALLAGLYGMWTMFALPGFSKVPRRLKVFAASSAGLQCTGFEINPMLLAYARGKARWTRVPSSQANFVNKDFWKTDLSNYNNVTVFLAPGVMEVLGDKLLRELPDDACVVACRFPFPHWPHQATQGKGLDQAWAYDISAVRSALD
ncbi:ATP synthase subunit C lysine N-methyltransferase isoform X2 [Esox lucius]|uniref:ATP synthase subunit C lysine N-methyltransferase isoform X2 n=1 Tax=Esox lucius TaxID=8010 RepID=UPI00097344AD|nr:ATP synthase subunit C lysine N-methyltransferase isoform X2 [Esox lucius]